MSDSKNVPIERVRVFRRDGSQVAEFKSNVVRSWVIGNEGRAQFTYPVRKTDIVNSDVLRFGNWLLVESSALPPWVGVFDPPFQWNGRVVTVSAYSPERVFDWRIGPLEEVVTGSAGSIFEYMLQRVNTAEGTLLRIGSIFRGGTQRQETFNPKPLKEYLRALWENSGEDYAWLPRTTADGKLLVYGNWYQFLGTTTSVQLHEGSVGGNIEANDNLLVEDGPIQNSILAYGDGETWTSKPNVTVTASISAGAYGLRETAVEYRNTTSVSTLEESGTKYLTEFKNPARSFSINALNVGDTFQYIGLGNIMQLRLQNASFRGSGVGYIGTVRIVGMSYNPLNKNKVSLVVREVT